MDGVLKSWAVPKGPPLEPGIRRLAMAVDDHAIEYGSFEGEIGKGKVKIWDKGEYELIERTLKLIRVKLNGSKLTGEYALIFFRENKGKPMWLILMAKGSATETKSVKRN
jgi:DNA ligase D-like protein (predicted 3'-phosphoesterase)